jgi:hypothetical protein
MKRIIICCAALFVTLAFAQNKSTIGLGATSCGSYINFRSSGDEDSKMLVGFYSQGYLSGLNAGMFANQRQTKSLPDGEAILSLVDSYCRRRPLERMDSALIELYTQLK